MVDAGYKVGILIAPVILVENWKELYGELKPGNYRLGKNVYDDGYINFYVEFTIE